MQRQQTVVDCPRSMVGRVIGKGGETIKALQQYTGAMIQIDQSCEPTKVTVAGSAQSLQLAVSMVRDIVAGNFKGFALLRQLTSGTGPQLPQGYEHFSQAQPVYVEGYGFVPPSQADLLRTAAISGLDTPPLGNNTLGDIHLGMLANGGLLELHDGLGGLSLNANSLAASGINGQQAQRVGMSSKPIISDQLTRNSITTMGSNTSSNTMASSLPLSQGVSQGNGLPFGWISMADPEGRVFYFHGLTGVAQWHAPLTQ
ncbi:hypothetical protein ABBQ32_008701 [Trebouxia sp. C0010 RCD-2024]